MIDYKKEKTGEKGLYSGSPWVDYSNGDEKVILDGRFTIDDLKYITEHMLKHENK